MNDLPLPNDIIETIEIMRWKLEMQDVLDDIITYGEGPKEDFCINCIYHGCRCANCASYIDGYKYGPGFFGGTRYFITDDDYEDEDTHVNLLTWILTTDPSKYTTITHPELEKVFDKPQYRYVN